MNAYSILAPDFQAEPHWWAAAPRPPENGDAVPQRGDVAVVGSGYTGLSAALTLARAGRDVVVFEAGPAGYGGSSRNAGFVGKTLKHSFSSLLDRHGDNYAISVYRELQDAFDYVVNLIREQQIDCHFEICGRYIAANSAAHYEHMARELEIKHKHLDDDYEMVRRQDQHRELGSDGFHGGAIVPSHGALHPGLYQLGLLERVKSSGAKVIDYTPVVSITNNGSHHTVATPRGSIEVRDVVIATNGYTGSATPWHQRRLIPFRGFMVATEELSEEILGRIFPKGRITNDFNNNLLFMRRAPDKRCLLLGGLTGTMTDNLAVMAKRLHTKISAIFPDLSKTRISRAWNGYCAGTFDLYPHVGAHDGMHYALGYCFAGVPMGTYLGDKMAKRILGSPGSGTVFDSRPFPAKWWYRGGTPWFLPIYMGHMNHLDRHGR